MPARHTSSRTKSQDKLRSSGRRKRVSARHQVKRLDRSSKEFALSKTIRQKKQVFFVRCGSSGPQFHRAPKPGLKSGPDVFADALVPRDAPFPGTLRSLERFVPRNALSPKRLVSGTCFKPALPAPGFIPPKLIHDRSQDADQCVRRYRGAPVTTRGAFSFNVRFE